MVDFEKQEKRCLWDTRKIAKSNKRPVTFLKEIEKLKSSQNDYSPPKDKKSVDFFIQNFCFKIKFD